MTKKHNQQSGASLIEVLVAVLILSFGMLALGGMMAYAVQMPKLAGYRSTASTLANAYVERMRANRVGFDGDFYASTVAEPKTFDVTTPAVFAINGVGAICTYAAGDCEDPAAVAAPTGQKIAQMDAKDILEMMRGVKDALGNNPGGQLGLLSGMRVTCNVACNTGEGDLWIMWREPENLASFNFANSDECPNPGDAPPFAPFPAPQPRCLHVRFKL